MRSIKDGGGGGAYEKKNILWKFYGDFFLIHFCAKINEILCTCFGCFCSDIKKQL